MDRDDLRACVEQGSFIDVESTPGGAIGVKAHPAVLIAPLNLP
jgi:hypothetical protein